VSDPQDKLPERKDPDPALGKAFEDLRRIIEEGES